MDAKYIIVHGSDYEECIVCETKNMVDEQVEDLMDTYTTDEIHVFEINKECPITVAVKF